MHTDENNDDDDDENVLSLLGAQKISLVAILKIHYQKAE